MRCTIIIFSLFALAYSYEYINQPGCGRRPRMQSTNKIVGGNEAVAGDWAWQVSMNYNDRHICGGTLISPKWILSAAHCLLYGDNPVGYSFAIGMHDRYVPQHGQEQINVEKIIVHPSYDSYTLWNDIVLFKLSSPASINGDTIIPACLEDKNTNIGGVDSWATGWGANVVGGGSVRHKFEVSKKVLTDDICSYSFGYINTKLQICAGENGLGKDTCQGDSGGPLVYRNSYDRLWYQIGITSFGAQNCGDGGVYTRVSAHIDWIKQTLLRN